MFKIIAIVGARPQFIKHCSLELSCFNKFNLKTIHTGQHYDTEMSQIFFDQLGMKRPDFMLEVGSGSHGAQTAVMLTEIEAILLKELPDGVIVYGDTNSTLAGSIAASKLNIPVFHIEAGLRSFNKEMPEEINRVLTDHVSSMLFVSSELSLSNLNNESIFKNIFVVGDIMKDLLDKIINSNLLIDLDIPFSFYYATLHRPYNTDDQKRLHYVLSSLNNLNKKVLFSIHPRTKNAMSNFGISESEFNNIKFIPPQGYINNLSYLSLSSGLITDSGGMQKEAYWMKKKCATIRKETEWVETLDSGWNSLFFNDLSSIDQHLMTIPSDYFSLYGDGDTSTIILDKIYEYLENLKK